MQLTGQQRLLCRTQRAVPVLHFPDLESSGAFSHAILTRKGGLSKPPYHSLNVGLSVGDDSEVVAQNRALGRAAAGVSEAAIVTCRQQSGSSVAMVRGAQGDCLPTADALVTATPGIFLAMTFADCVPVIIADPGVPVLGLVHAGWRGSVSSIVLAAWQAMQGLGARAGRSRAYIGPAIGGCCYEVGAEVVEAVLALGAAGQASLTERGGRFYLDLPGLNEGLLAEQGVATVQSGVCTACHRDWFFSHRADGGRTGRFAVYAGVV